MLARRFMIGLVAGIAALAVGAPLAGAGNRLVDDYWRDQAVVASPTADRIVDDYWRDGLRGVKPAPLVTDRIVDDYFRDAPAVVATGDGFDWGDFGIGIAVAVGSMLVLAGLGAGLAVRRSRGETPNPAGTA
jgi:hypothetical protein